MSPAYLQYNLSTAVDVSIIAVDHAECHGVVCPLGNIFHKAKSPLKDWRLHLCLLGRPIQVSQKQFVPRDPLHGLDEVGIDVLSVPQLGLDLLGGKI